MAILSVYYVYNGGVKNELTNYVSTMNTMNIEKNCVLKYVPNCSLVGIRYVPIKKQKKIIKI